MRKIDKSHIISTKYKEWESSLQGNHPNYTSSNHRFYYDIVMSLFYCQSGVCAYTEVLLCVDDFYSVNCWKDGKYIFENPQFFGALDHFDPTLKVNKAWLWDNLFMVQKDINDKHKRELPVDTILKPDSVDYDPFVLMEYDEISHIFFANVNQEESLQERINKMILTLGLNHSTIIRKRKRHLESIFEKIDFISTWQEEENKNHQFFTALAMFKQKNKLIKSSPSNNSKPQ